MKEVLLWKAPFEPKPEPRATLTYGNTTYLIPYTLMHWLSGWVAMGMHGSHADANAMNNVSAMLDNLTSQICSSCGHRDKKSRESQSRYKCIKCNHELNADVNAAFNILDRALA